MIAPLETFQIEAREHLVNLEAALLELEEQPEESEAIDTAFRAIHTIKGAAGMFGFQQLTDFAHHLETALDKLRQGKLDVSKTFIEIFLDAGDLMAEMLEDTEFSAGQTISSEKLLERLYQIAPEDDPRKSLIQAPEVQGEPASEEAIYRVRFKPDRDSFKNGFDAMPVIRELTSLGTAEVICKHENLPAFNQLEPQASYLSWELLLVTEASKDTLMDAFMFVADEWQIQVDEIDIHDTDEDADKLGELLVARGNVAKQALDEALGEKPAIGSLLKEQGVVQEEEVKAALKEQQLTRKVKAKKQAGKSQATVRVPAEKLDSLMNLVGELVIVQARLNQVSDAVNNDDIEGIAEELELLTTQMRDETFGIRMMPIGSTFGRFRRLVRDLSSELGKSIQLDTQGADTELDKVVLDKLADPLIHLIRNSIDHGIEPTEDRLALGKTPTGNILLSASHADSQVVITIKDDGRGLNKDKIKAKAIEKQLITSKDQLTDEQIHQLIFEPGFSTAAKVSDISGRGVGMDVVKRSIMELGGKLSIDSAVGEGTELTIRLPMTLAIIEGLMVAVGTEYYVLPLNNVEECIELTQSNTHAKTRRRIVELRGQQIPYLSLREWFEVPGDEPPIQQVVITHSGSERFGFCVDEVVGQYQTVIKRLGKLYEGVSGFSGATILGDGSVAMILDPVALIDSVSSSEFGENTTQPIRMQS